MIRIAIAIALMLVASTTMAQTFPSRTIRIIVPSTAGGAADFLARLLAQHMAPGLGQTIVVDNRPGAGNTIGTDAVAKAAPDGHTLLMAINNHAINASLYPTLPYDPIKDFEPISLVVSTPHMLVVHPSLGVKSVAELIAAARAKPGAINYASAGNGTAAHFAAELFKLGARVDLTHVPYKGVTPALNDTVGGTVGVMFPAPLIALQHVKAGKLVGLAVTSRTRSSQMPDLPTLAESGVPGYEFGSWYGLLAPRDTPPAIVQQLFASMKQALGTKEVMARIALDAAEPVGSTPAEFRRYLVEEVERYAKLVKALGLKAE